MCSAQSESTYKLGNICLPCVALVASNLNTLCGFVVDHCSFKNSASPRQSNDFRLPLFCFLVFVELGCVFQQFPKRINKSGINSKQIACSGFEPVFFVIFQNLSGCRTSRPSGVFTNIEGYNVFCAVGANLQF